MPMGNVRLDVPNTHVREQGFDFRREDGGPVDGPLPKVVFLKQPGYSIDKPAADIRHGAFGRDEPNRMKTSRRGHQLTW